MIFSRSLHVLAAIFMVGLLPVMGSPEASIINETKAAIDSVAASDDKEKAGVSPSPYVLFRIPGTDSGFPITNSMVTSWIISLIIIVAIRLMVGKPTLVPGKGQAVVESLVQGIKDLVEPIVGSHMVRPTFWLLVGLFTFILIQNWSGLIPGVGAFGIEYGSGDSTQLKYWQRPGNADLNMTLALAAVVQLLWIYFVFRYAGLKALIYDWFGNKAEKREVGTVMFILLTPIFIGVGFIELISWFFRLISLSFRLYGNVFGGENLLTGMTNLIPALPYLVPVPFYFLELLIGLVQALVFTLLAAVYIGLICNHEGGDHEHAH